MSALTDLFAQIADAIRTKGGTSEQITASNFPTAISNISGAIHGTQNFTGNPATITIPEAAGKENLLMVLSPIADAGQPSNYHTYGIIVLNGVASSAMEIKTVAQNGGPTTWDSATGTIALTNSACSGPWNWVAW
jgi:hypothetical protein